MNLRSNIDFEPLIKDYDEIADEFKIFNEYNNCDWLNSHTLWLKSKEEYKFIIITDYDYGIIIGYLMFHIKGGNGFIYNLIVEENHRNQGIARALIDFALNIPVNKVLLDCNKDLVPFYNKWGFKVKETNYSLGQVLYRMELLKSL